MSRSRRRIIRFSATEREEILERFLYFRSKGFTANQAAHRAASFSGSAPVISLSTLRRWGREREAQWSAWTVKEILTGSSAFVDGTVILRRESRRIAPVPASLSEG